MNKDTEWTWETIYELEDQFWSFVANGRWRQMPLLRRIVEQMGREMLILQASDWQFLITTWSARNYAETRFAQHSADLTRLIDVAKRVEGGGALSWEDGEFLKSKEAQDFCFPDLAAQFEVATERAQPA